MKILSAPVDKGGCGHYRVRQPLKIIQELGLAETYVLERKENTDEVVGAVKEADIIILRPRAEKLMWFVKDRMPECEAKFVLDNDDNTFEIDPYSDSYRSFGLKDVKHKDKWLWKAGESGFDPAMNQAYLDRYKIGMEDSDMVTVTTDKLGEVYKPYNDNVKAIPNAVDTKMWHKLPFKKTTKPIKITWGGGASHYRDLWSIKDIWTDLFKKYDLHFITCGTRFKGAMKGIPENKQEYHKWVHAEAHPYKQMTLGADIGICPLDTELGFNLYKSEVKWLEYSALEIPCVVSDLVPYSSVVEHGVTGFIAKNNQEWSKYLEMLIKDPKLRSRMGKAARKWVEKNRDIRVIAKEYIKIYEELINKPKK